MFFTAILAANGYPLLLSYQADGTPSLTRVYRTCVLDDLFRTRRCGGKRQDFYLERGLALYIDAVGVQHARVLAREARVMPDKTAWAAYDACLDFIPLGREKKHQGITIQHYGFDRGPLFQPLSRHLRARSQLYIDKNLPAEERWPALLREWVVLTGCVDHDIMNSLLWGVRPFLENERKDLRDIFQVIRSLREGYSLLIDYLPEWVQKAVYKPRRWEEKHALEFWLTLGLDPPVARALTQLDLRIEDGQLTYSQQVERTPEFFERLVDLILIICRFEKFNKGRFCSVGPASRSLVAALHVGIGVFVTWLLARKDVAPGYLSQFLRLRDELRFFKFN